MQKRIFTSIIIILLILCVSLGLLCDTVFTATEKEYTKEEIHQVINETQSIKDNAHNMAESARNLGWDDEDELIKDLQFKWYRADKKQRKYQDLLTLLEIEEEKVWLERAEAYPAATQIWKYMKAQGWNDYVCAGIMGNMMVEAGGQTLNIRYNALAPDGYYGICQWNKGYVEVWNTDLTTQCDFLADTIKYEFDTYGFKYQKNFNFASFLNITDAEDAALAFAKVYERCSSFSYGIRQKNAIKAYNYFVD